MRDSAMVIMWPTRDADGSYSSVTLSQRKAPFETMPTHDPDPPFIATLDLSETSVRFSLSFKLQCSDDKGHHILCALLSYLALWCNFYTRLLGIILRWHSHDL